MPQLAKGGKWVFGWVVVKTGRKIAIPPEAYREYGFQTGDALVFLKGSRRSGGFGIGRANTVPTLLKKRALALGRLDEGSCVIAPLEVGIQVGDRLLAIRGSGHALGLLARGPIFEEALRHPELRTF